MFSDTLGVLIPVLDCLACWIVDLGFFVDTSKTGFDPFMANVCSIVCRRSIGRTLTFNTPSFSIAGVWVRLFCWQTSECMSVSLSQVVSSYFTSVGFRCEHDWLNADFRPCTIDHSVATRETLGDQKPYSSPSAFILSVPIAAGYYETDWDFGGRPAGPCTGHDRHYEVFSTIQGFVGISSLPILDHGLDVLQLAESRSAGLLTLIELCGVLTS